MTSDAALLFIDAIEGDRARVLMGIEAFTVPTRLLPEGATEGSWLRLSLRRALPPSDDSDAVRRRLGHDDDGGDIKL